MVSKKFFLVFLVVVSTFFAATVSFAHTETGPVVLTEDNFTTLIGEVNSETIGSVLTDITKSDPEKPFYIYIQSPGGDVIAGLKLVNYLQTTNRNIICIADIAISMAFMTMEACPTRLGQINSIMMSHQISGGAQGSLREVKARVGLMEKLSALLETMVQRRVGLTNEEYQAKINPEWWILGGAEVKKERLVDQVVTILCSIPLEKSGKCPLTN